MQNESFLGISAVKDCGKMQALEKLLCSWVLQGDKIFYSVTLSGMAFQDAGDFAFRDLMALRKPTWISLLLMTLTQVQAKGLTFKGKTESLHFCCQMTFKFLF